MSEPITYEAELAKELTLIRMFSKRIDKLKPDARARVAAYISAKCLPQQPEAPVN